MNIVVTGSIAYDYLMTFPGRFQEHILPDQLARLSVSFLVDAMVRQRGGVATNIAYNLALLGERPRVMATVGQDFADYRAWLESQGIDTSAIKTIADDFTASFFVSTDQENNQIAMFYTGAMAYAHTLTFRDVTGAPVELAIISPNDPRAMVQYPRECQELGIPYLYDPSQQIIRLTGDQLRAGITGARLVMVNEYEFEMIREKTGLSEEEVTQRAAALVVTRGAQGSTIHTTERSIDIPVVSPARIVDPTGVGDAYRAGLIKGLALGVPWEICGRMGALAAAYVLEEKGCQNHRYTRSEFVARYRQHFDDHGWLDAMIEPSSASDWDSPDTAHFWK
jgi:adenosine kinase